jgi:hypothetical protein
MVSAIKASSSAIPAWAADEKKEMSALHIVGVYRYNGITTMEHDAPIPVKTWAQSHG